MHIRSLSAIVGSLIVAPLAAVKGQLSLLPQCADDCVNNSGDFNCSALDLNCICGLANGAFLTNIVTCFKTNCDSDLDGLLLPLTVACKLAGHPIPQSAVDAAKTATAGSTGTKSSAVAYSTVTVAETTADSYQTSAAAVRVSTVTSTQTDSNGSVYYILVPVTVGSTATVTGTPSTASATTTASSSSPTSTSVAAAVITTSFKDQTSTVFVTPSTSASTSAKNGNNGQAGTPFSGAIRNGIGGASLLGLAVALLGGMIWL